MMAQMPPDVKERIEKYLEGRREEYMPSEKEAELFLKKVEEVQKKVQGIISGEIELTEHDRREIEADQRKRTIEEIRKREA